jgi:hypothetical protein
MNDTIKAAVRDAMDENPSAMADKINAALYAKVEDALKTKKMEVSNSWLNDLEAASTEEKEE